MLVLCFHTSHGTDQLACVDWHEPVDLTVSLSTSRANMREIQCSLLDIQSSSPCLHTAPIASIRSKKLVS